MELDGLDAWRAVIVDVEVDGFEDSQVQVSSFGLAGLGVEVAGASKEPASDVEPYIESFNDGPGGGQETASLSHVGVDLGLPLPEIGDLQGSGFICLQEPRASLLQVLDASRLGSDNLVVLLAVGEDLCMYGGRRLVDQLGIEGETGPEILDEQFDRVSSHVRQRAVGVVLVMTDAEQVWVPLAGLASSQGESEA